MRKKQENKHVKKYYVYEHYDPDTNEVVYVGKGTHGRAWSLQDDSSSKAQRGGRKKEHYDWALSLLNQGKTPDQFVKIVERGLTQKDACKLETEYKWKLRPKFNQKNGFISRLNKAEVERFRNDGYSYSQLAEKFDAAPMTVWRCLNNKTWGDFHEQV